MNVNFAITEPYTWAVEELNSRSNLILNPGNARGNNWATQRTPWVRMLSNAMIAGKPKTTRNEYILYSGNLNTFDSSYHTAVNDRYRFRPRPGITSIKTDFKGTMGSTKSAIVEFQCWSLDDLEIIEQLYMVPGMSIILEWGWSLNSKGEMVGPLSTFLDTPSKDSQFMIKIMKSILKYRKDYYGSYDGLVGIVTNFNYKLNDQLGFDCSVELVAPGEMWLEENSTNTSAGCSSNDNDKQKKQSNLEYRFHQFYTKCKDPALINLYNKAWGTLGNIKPSIIYQKWEVETREYDKESRTWYKAASEYIDPTQKDEQVYISWAKFVETLNKNVNLYFISSSKEPILDNSESNPKLGLDLIPVTILPKLFSLDPRVCTFAPVNIDPVSGANRSMDRAWSEVSDSGAGSVGNAVGGNIGLGASVYGAASYIWGATKYAITEVPKHQDENLKIRETYPANSLPELTDETFAKDHIKIFGDTIDKDNLKNDNSDFSLKEDKYVGLLNNIFLNTGFLRDCVGSGEHVNMQDFLRKILSELNDATGGLWNLTYMVDEKDPSRIHIYDANYSSAKSRAAELEPYTFSVVPGEKYKGPLIHSAVVESKLVDGFKTMVLYGQANDNGNTDTANQGLSLYSDTVWDGYKFATFDDKKTNIHVNLCYQEPGSEKTAKSPGIPDDPEKDLDEAYFTILDAVDDESVSGAKNAMASYIAFLNSSKKEVADVLPKNNNVILPFNFSITIDGFSGFIWGNIIAFDYLPNRYFKNSSTFTNGVYFQITKISNNVTTAGWSTTIETIMRLRNSKGSSGNKAATGEGIISQDNPDSETKSNDPGVTHGDTCQQAEAYIASATQPPNNNTNNAAIVDPENNVTTPKQLNVINETKTYVTEQTAVDSDLNTSIMLAKQKAAETIQQQIISEYGNDQSLIVTPASSGTIESTTTVQLPDGTFKSTYSTTRTFTITINK